MLYLLLLAALAFPQAQDYPDGNENALQKVQPGRQLFKEDVACGGYFWRSEKADKFGSVVVYYFFGSREWGKARIGLYQQGRYTVVIDEEKDPPTAQVLADPKGKFQGVRVRMTRREYESARACFSRN
jgi:hypothetical protein